MPPKRAAKKKEAELSASQKTKVANDAKKVLGVAEWKVVETIWDGNNLVLTFGSGVERVNKKSPKKKSTAKKKSPIRKTPQKNKKTSVTKQKKELYDALLIFSIVDENGKKLKLTKDIQSKLLNSIHNIISNAFESKVYPNVTDREVMIDVHINPDESEETVQEVIDNIEDQVHDSFIYTKQKKHVTLKLEVTKPIGKSRALFTS